MSRSRRKAGAAKASPGTLPNIEFLLDGNCDITFGRVGPVRCAATAADGDQCLAMLVRRPGESLMQLLRRLDAAIEDACENGIYIDESTRRQIPCVFRTNVTDDSGRT